jgi:PhzF family phenazine biosynthesis protein
VPALAGASHAVFLDVPPGAAETTVRFFTSEGELPACGHGTVAALAYLAERTHQDAGEHEHRMSLRPAGGGQLLEGLTGCQGRLITAEFAVPSVALRVPTAEELGLLLPALGLPYAPAAVIATLGRPRLLVEAASREALRALSPDLPTTEAACRRLGLLGCYAYAAPASPHGRYAARMFAPAIGVPEDIANANSTACLATALYATGTIAAEASRPARLAVDMGDSLASPATVTATVTIASDGRPHVQVGGTARIGETLRLDLG